MNEWVIESYVGNVGWSISKINCTPEGHTLDWCLQQWQAHKTGIGIGLSLPETQRQRYRLRNLNTNDIIMCAIL